MGVESRAHPPLDAEAGPESQPLRRLARSSGVYALASVAAPLIGLVLSPFLTHHLSLSEYGALAVINTAISLAVGLTQLNLASAVVRAYLYDYPHDGQRAGIIATATALLCLVAIPCTAIVVLLAPTLASLLLGRRDLGPAVALAAGVVLVQNLTVPGLALLRARSRALPYSLLSLANLLVTLGSTVVLVGALHAGVAGAVLGNGLGYACIVCCTLPGIIWRQGLRIRPEIARSMLAYGLPLVLNFLSYWVLQLLDRFLLSRYVSLAETATYTVAYTLGSVLAVVVINPFLLAWPTIMFATARRQDAAGIFRELFRWFSLLLLFAAYALALAATVFLSWLFPAGYQAAASVIPLVAAALVFYGIYYLFMIGANVRRMTWLAGVLMTLAAGVNIGLNLLLIPRYGMMGAAIATLAGYAVLAGAACLLNRRLYPVPFELARFSCALLLGGGLYVACALLARGHATAGRWGIDLGGLLVYGCSLAWLGKVPLARLGRRSGHRRGARPLRVCMHVRGPLRSDARVRREARTLLEEGYAVTVVDVEPQAVAARSEQIEGIAVRHLVKPAWFVRTRLPWRVGRSAEKFLFSTLALWRVEADIYHAHDVNALTACYCVARLRRRPLLFDAHELPLYECDRVHPLLRRLLWRGLSHLLARCAGIITVSPAIVQEMRTRYAAGDITLLRNIPPYQAFAASERLRQRCGLSAAARIALYQGNLQADRGLDLLVRAARFLAAEHVIVLMGRAVGETGEQLEALIASEGVAAQVKILPAVPYAELGAWTASADVGLLLFAPDFSANIRLCLPNKLFEYLMAGLPVLATPLEAVSEVLRATRAGRIVSALTPAGIGAALNALLADPAGLANLRANALLAAREELCWEQERQQLTALYRRLPVGEKDAHSLRI
jgi:O-antigen/teichoic acid export membrane protein/glycosyltransferase involved in cell wall biosynthesis